MEKKQERGRGREREEFRAVVIFGKTQSGRTKYVSQLTSV